MEFTVRNDLGIGGASEFKIADGGLDTWNPKGPRIVWEYECECGETHFLASAAVDVVRCQKTGAEMPSNTTRHRIRSEPVKPSSPASAPTERNVESR